MEVNELERSGRLATVIGNRRESEARRERVAAEFRARLLRELAPEVAASAAGSALVDAAVGAHVEISETNARFLRGRATPAALSRLNLVRSQLLRTLRALGLLAAISGDPSDPMESPSEPLSSWVGALKAAANASADTSSAESVEAEVPK